MKQLTCNYAKREQITCTTCKYARACLDKVKVNGEPAGFRWWGDKTPPVRARNTNPPSILEHVLSSGDARKIGQMTEVLSAYGLKVRDIMDETFDMRKRSKTYSW